MKAIYSLVISSMLLASSSLLARPQVKTDVLDEAKRVDETIAHIEDYQAKGWAIGLTGDTLKPDQFLKFFQDRNLEMKMYVNSISGVRVGDYTAYEADVKMLEDYKANIIREEIAELDTIVVDMTNYQRQSFAVGIDADTMAPDHFLKYFSEHSLPIEIYLAQKFVTIGNVGAYERNLKALQDYRDQLVAAQGEVSTSL